MDSTVLVETLRKTTYPDNTVVKAAEAQLKQWRNAPCYSLVLLHIASSKENPSDPVHLAAALQFKNTTSLLWDSVPLNSGQPTCICDSDKQQIRASLVECVCTCSESSVQLHLCLAASKIAFIELTASGKSRWPDFLSKTLTMINSGYLYGALLLLRTLVRMLEFSSDKERPIVFEIVGAIFPTLEPLFASLVSQSTSESFELQLLVIKIVWSTTQQQLPPYLQSKEKLDGWLTLIKQVLERPTAQNFNDFSSAWWRCKKRASEICSRYMYKIGNPKESSKNLRPISKHFHDNWAVPLTISFMNILGACRQGSITSPPLIHVAFKHLCFAIRLAITWKTIQPHLDVLVSQLIFPHICFSPQQYELWTTDPFEYLRTEYDIHASYYNPKEKGQELLAILVRYRTSDTLKPIMDFVYQGLAKCAEIPSPESVRMKEGLLVLIGSLEGKIKRTEPYKSATEGMLKAHVFPEFVNPCGILRARACWLFGLFSKIKFSDPQSYFAGLQQILNLTSDPEFPVQVNAALALRFIVQNPIGKDYIRSILPKLIEIFFGLMNKWDNDDIIETLEVTISVFGSEITPYAEGIIIRLTETFLRMCADTEEDELNNMLAAVSCLEAISACIDALKTQPQIIAVIEPHILGITKQVLSSGTAVLDYLDDILNIITKLTLYPSSPSPLIWEVFSLLYESFMSYAVDYLMMVPPFDNFISKGNAVFISNPAYLEMIFNIIKRMLAEPKMDPIECFPACTLAEVVFHNCVGSVDQFASAVVELAVWRLAHNTNKTLQLLLLEVVANALFYNPALTLDTLEKKGQIQYLFTTWFQSLRLFRHRIYDKKLLVLGLSSILRVPFPSLPNIVQMGTKQIISTVVDFILSIQKHKTKIAKAMKKLDQEYPAHPDGENAEYGYDDGDDLSEEFGSEEATFDELTEMAKQAREAQERDDDDDSDSDSNAEFLGVDEEEDALEFHELDDESEFDSPIHHISEAKFFVSVLQGLMQESVKYPQLSSILGDLTPTEQAEIQKLINQVNEDQEKKQ